MLLSNGIDCVHQCLLLAHMSKKNIHIFVVCLVNMYDICVLFDNNRPNNSMRIQILQNTSHISTYLYDAAKNGGLQQRSHKIWKKSQVLYPEILQHYICVIYTNGSQWLNKLIY
jgi:hypothetical protein